MIEIRANPLRKAASVPLFFFLVSVFTTNIPLYSETDILLKARMLITEGDFEAAVNELHDIINKLKTIPTASEKPKLAEAYYILARVYKILQMDTQYKENLHAALSTYPHLSIPESDPDIREAVRRIKEAQQKELQKVPVPNSTNSPNSTQMQKVPAPNSFPNSLKVPVPNSPQFQFNIQNR